MESRENRRCPGPCTHGLGYRSGRSWQPQGRQSNGRMRQSCVHRSAYRKVRGRLPMLAYLRIAVSANLLSSPMISTRSLA